MDASLHLRQMQTLTVVTQFYYPERIGTAFYTRDLVQAIADREDCSVQVVTGEPYYPEFKRYAKYDTPVRSEVIDGVRVHRLRTYVPKPASPLARILSELNFVARGAHALVRGRIPRTDHVICFAPGMLTVLLGRFVASPEGQLLTIVHDLSSGLAKGTGLVSSKAAGRALQRVEAWVFNKSDTLAVLSPQMYQVIRAMGVARPMKIVPLWIRDVLAASEPVPGPAEPIVMYSGSLGRKQGVHRLLALAKGLQDAVPETRMIIRGQGSMARVVRTEVQDLGNIEFQGLVADEDLAGSLSGGRVHLVLQDPDSANFSVPSKVFSTLAAGRPMVATARPGTPLHDLARLCPAVTCVDPDDPEALLGEVRRRLGRPGACDADGLIGRRYVLENHGREHAVNELLQLVLAGRSPGKRPVGAVS